MTNRRDNWPRPLAGLVVDANELLALADESLAAARADQSNRKEVLACFLFAYHLKDWSGVSNADFFGAAPFAQTMYDIANGTKHLALEPSKHPNHVREVAEVRGYGMGPYSGGPYGAPYISVTTRRWPNDDDAVFGALTILEEVIAWWRARLGPSPAVDGERT